MGDNETQEITALLRVCRKVYTGEMVILLPNQLLQVKLEGTTEAEQARSLETLAQDCYELIHENEYPPTRQMTYSFVRQFGSVLRTQLSYRQMKLVLENYMKKMQKKRRMKNDNWKLSISLLINVIGRF